MSALHKVGSDASTSPSDCRLKEPQNDPPLRKWKHPTFC
jgi:hypothetical protein